MKSTIGFLLFGILFSTAGMLHADVKLASIFTDHMVLQQDVPIPIWGTAEAGEEVKVTFADRTAKTKAGADGKWRVDLEKCETNATPQILSADGKENSVKVIDVLVGDVWVCSGQTNMETSLREAHNAKEEQPHIQDPQLRVFRVAQKSAVNPFSDCVGSWMVCAPETVGNFSAVGYFYGKELRKSLNRPIGLIGTYASGSTAQAWISSSGLEKDTGLSKYSNEIQKIRSEYDQKSAEYPKLMEAYKAEYAKWEEEVGREYRAAYMEWTEASKKAKAAGQPEPPKPTVSRARPVQPIPPEGGRAVPTNLFNGMVAPLIPFAIKGVIWYQGESNVVLGGEEYKKLFPALIADWREKWGLGDFPFLYAQLSAYDEKPSGYNEKPFSATGWPILREAQLQALSIPNTGMAVTIDIGDAKNVYPKDKLDVGLRLALAAKKVAYGQEIIHSGPIYDSMKVEGNKVRVSFKNAGSGLVIGVPPWLASGEVPLPAYELMGFTVAGEDKKWVAAKARTDGDTLLVWSDEVAVPAAVRYGWSNFPECNLYNKEKLPASPFRTDNWEP